MTSRHTLTKQNPRLWLVGKWLAIFFAGFVVGFAAGFPVRRYLVFKNEVQVGDLLNLFSAILVALVLQNAIQRRVSNIRVEKDLLIARITATDTALNETHKLFMRRAEDVPSVTEAVMYAAFRDLSNQLHLLEQALAKSKTPMTSIDLNALKAARHEYRKRVLGDDFSRPLLPAAAINREQRTYRKFATELITVTFDVNHQ
jgi:hypothetical protein